ncbi:leucine-rich repeat-containing protein 45-like [Liolophura sinensis]|uniref:leucine-rich repeat-containing protein 45-like n=1 Tax=Liolophura sinensis TaxID=3198878 RepID=UPI00315908BD
MEEFRHTFVRLCRDNHIEAQECVLTALKSAEQTPSTAVLNLSTNNVSAKNCAALGKVLATDRTFVELRLSDCMLTEDAVKGIAYGLTSNVWCRKLDLKGNNIRGVGVEVLGKMLRHNNTLASMCLEWNSVGMIDNSFAVFCEGLGSNSALKALDLRNNQISHDGAAELAAGLKRNTSLKSLDLRWNNVGLLGGRALLEMLESNKTLTRLELAGNNVPSDILKAIETAVGHNGDRQALSESYSKRTQTLTHHIRQLEKDKNSQMGDLMNTLDRQEEILRKTKRSSSHKIGSLQESLEERKAAFNSLAAKLALTESELSLAEQKYNDSTIVIQRLKQELADNNSSHQSELRREREDRALTETKMLKELSESNDRCIHLESKLGDVERKCKQQQEEIFDLKEQVAHLQADLKLKRAQYDDKIQQIKQQNKETVREMDVLKQKEINRLHQESEESEKVLKDRIGKLERQRLDLEEEVGRHKSLLAQERLQAEEQLMIAKQRAKTEEDHRVKQLEDKVHLLQTTKDDLHLQCNQQTGMISDLQSKNSNLSLELESMRRRLEDLNVELANKNNVVMTEVGKVKMEMTQQLSKFEGERQMTSELRDKLDKADRELSEQLLRHREAMETKDKEIVLLQEKLKGRELELTRIKEEESQRATMLQSAILNYCNRPSLPSK